LAGNAYSLTGTGTAEDPYRISSFDDFNLISLGASYWSSHIVLECDLDLDPNLPGRKVYERAVIAPQGSSFAGTFDGKGYAIRNLVIDGTLNSDWYFGLFGETTSDAVLRNISIENFRIYGGTHLYVGALAGLSRGTITGCQSHGNIAMGDNSWVIGGLIGNNSGTVEVSSSNVSIKVGDDCKFIAGLIGRGQNDSIFKCHATVMIDAGSKAYFIGGLVGESIGGVIRTCYAGAHITCEANAWKVGGLLGYHQGDIWQCYAYGIVEGGNQSREVGGLVGHIVGKYDRQGLLVRRSYVNDCYARVGVRGGESCRRLGGMAGHCDSTTLTNCYSVGCIVTGVDFTAVGGFMGGRAPDSYSMGCYWDMDASGLTTGVGQGSTFQVYGRTSEELKRKNTYSWGSWNFANTWSICEGTSYPRLKWQIEPTDWVCPDGIGLEDFSFLATRWLQSDCAITADCGGTDIDESGTVSFPDLMMFCETWLDDR